MMILMDLTETVNLLKSMIGDCSELNGHDFLIAPAKIPGSMVEGYQLHITGEFNEDIKKYISDIAVKNNLAITQHPDSVMIYKAKTPANS